MKKTLCLFSLMMGFVLTVSSVFAATVYKYDETYYMKGTSDQAYAILEGNEDKWQVELVMLIQIVVIVVEVM